MIHLLFLLVLNGPNATVQSDVYQYLMESAWQISELVYPEDYNWAAETIRPCEKDDRIHFAPDGYCYQFAGETLCYPEQKSECKIGRWILERNQKYLLLHEENGLRNRYTILKATDDLLHLTLRVDVGMIEFIYRSVSNELSGTDF